MDYNTQELRPSTVDFFEKKIKGSSKWTLKRITKACKSAQMSVLDYNFYQFIGKSIKTAAEVENADSALVCPDEYVEVPFVAKEFATSKPTEEDVKAILAQKAIENVRKTLFGNVEKKRQLYVIEHLSEEIQNQEQIWLSQKEDFQREQQSCAIKHKQNEQKKRQEVDEQIAKYKAEHEANNRFLYGNQEEIEADLAGLDTFFPGDLNIYYQVDLPNKLVNISFEAPALRLFTSARVCSKKETNKLYLNNVCGMAYVLASQCFDKSGKIDNVVISAFSNQFDEKSATLKEVTLYAVAFDRETFTWAIEPESFMPYETLVFFPHSISVSHEDDLLAVNPMEMSPASDRPVGGNMFVGNSKDARYKAANAPLKPIERESVSSEGFHSTEPFKVRSIYPDYRWPDLNMLEGSEEIPSALSPAEVAEYTDRLCSCLKSFGVKYKEVVCISGPAITLYEIFVEYGVKFNSIKRIEDDIAMAVKSRNAQVVQYEDFIGVEVVNSKPKVVSMKAILNSDEYREFEGELPVALGCKAGNEVEVIDLETAPHLLISGAARQGKTNAMNAVITSLLYAKHPTEVKFVLVDPKMVEFSPYTDMYKHFLATLPDFTNEESEKNGSVITNLERAEMITDSLCKEIDERFKNFVNAGVNEIKRYNLKFASRALNPADGHHHMPYIVVLFDEYTVMKDSVTSKEARATFRNLESNLATIAQKGSAAGIHLVISTQRSNADDMDPSIKEHFQKKLSFKVATRFDSNSALGFSGAENLSAPGDCLYCDGDELDRIQTGYLDFHDAGKLSWFIGSQTGSTQGPTTPYYLPEPGENIPSAPAIDFSAIDPMFEEAARLAVMNQQISTSILQRKLQLGFARAGRVMDQLEAAGIIMPGTGAKPRIVLVPDLASLQPILDAFIK